jgi:hypothetical protein
MTAFINAISIPEFIFERTWWRLFQKRVVNVPDGGYSRNASWTYLMEVIPETRRERTRLLVTPLVSSNFSLCISIVCYDAQWICQLQSHVIKKSRY